MYCQWTATCTADIRRVLELMDHAMSLYACCTAPLMYCHAVPQINDVSIRVVELMDHVLSMYDRAIGQYTAGELSAAALLRPLLPL